MELADPGDDRDFERWGFARRLRWNLNALRTLRALRAGGQISPELKDRALRAYTGWGGFRAVVSDLPVGEDLFDKQTEAAIVEVQAARRENRRPSSVVKALDDYFSTQYFTPIEVCGVMWHYALQLVQGDVGRVLEPSAGVGRMLDALPVGQIGEVTLQTVEYDSTLGALLAARYPTAAVQIGPLEELATPAEPFDVVISNPPFMDRAAVLRSRAAPNIDRAEHYALLRSLALLRPGGVLVVLTPYSLVSGTSSGHTEHRQRMHTWGDFRGAVLLPNACFPTVASVLCVQIWTRRGEARGEAEAAALAFTPYTPPPGNILGQLIEEGRFSRVAGAFDLGAASAVSWLPLDTPWDDRWTWKGGEVGQGINAPTTGMGPVRPRRPRRVEAAPPVGTAAYQHASLASLGARLAVYFHRLGRQQLTLAEIGRGELLTDLAWHQETWGSPSKEALTQLDRAHAEAWERYNRVAISQTPLVSIEEVPKMGSSPYSVVEHYCRINGFCSEDNLDKSFPGQPLLQPLIDLGVYLEPAEGGGFRYFTEDFFLMGDLTARLSACSAASGLDIYPEVKARMIEGITKLQGVIGATSILTLGITPRASVIPSEIRTAWAKSYLEPVFHLQYDGGYFSFLVERGDGELVTPADYEAGAGEDDGSYFDHTKGRMVKPRNPQQALDKTHRKALVLRAAQLLGYFNRQVQVSLGGEGKVNIFRGKGSYALRAAQEQEIEDHFTRWLSLSENAASAASLEAVYNERVHRQAGRIYSTDPYPLARQSVEIMLSKHQNQTVRWQTERVGGCIWDAVGAGKSFMLLASFAAHRQSGRARRMIAVVPNSTLAQWYTEARRFLPDYRICLIGMTTVTGRDGKDRVRDDTPEMRKEKWEAFAKDYYDIVLVGPQSFLSDVYPSEETIEKVISDQTWLSRGLARMAQAKGRAEKRLERILQELDELEAARDRRGGTFHPSSQEKYDALQIEKAKALQEISVNTPTDKQLIDSAEDGESALPSIYRPEDAADLIAWEDVVGPDVLLAIDEAHTYKNLWHPAPRLGASKIAFLGSTKEQDDEADLTKLCWDLLFKTTHLSGLRGDEQGILLMTATPLQNSPIELYNLYSYLSPTFWTKAGIFHKEEFIDRFLHIDEVNTAAALTLDAETGPGVLGYRKPGPLNELLSILAPVTQRRTKEDLTGKGFLALPAVKRENLTSPLYGVQARVNNRLRGIAEERILRKERKREKIATKDDEEWTWIRETKLVLTLMGLLEKTALDARLLLLNWYRSQNVPLEERRFRPTKGSPKEEPMDEHLEFVYNYIWEALGQEDADGPGLVLPDDLEDADHPAKYGAITGKITADWLPGDEATPAVPRFGILIFLDSVEAHSWFLQALEAAGLTQRPGDPEGAPSRVAFIHGKISKDKRDAIALGFNGQDESRDPVTGRLIQERKEPIYDIVIGNSKAMATGLNLQRRTGAIYHANYTWEPATIEQREGRGVRQGNTLGAIRIYQCIAEHTFDSILLNTTQGKAEWQNEVFTGNAPLTFETGDREEALIRWLVRDPSAAQKMFERIRTKRGRDMKLRLHAAAWRMWLAAYTNLRQIPREPSRGGQILAGVRYMLDHAHRESRNQLSDDTVNALIAGKLVYPDIPRRLVYYYCGNRITLTTGETRDVLILQAHVTDRTVTIFWREYGRLEVSTTHIYRPGFVPAGTPQDPDTLQDFSEISPFPGAAAVEPIPWSRRDEAPTLRVTPLTAFRACLDVSATPRADATLAQMVWGNLARREDLGWAQEVAPYYSPGFLQAFKEFRETPALQSQAQGKHIGVSAFPFALLPDGRVVWLAPPAYNPNAGKRNPTSAIAIQRMLTPRIDDDLDLIYKALREDTLVWMISGFPEDLISPASSDLFMDDVVASLIWSLYLGWGQRIPKDILASLLSQVNEVHKKRHEAQRAAGSKFAQQPPLTITKLRAVVGVSVLPPAGRSDPR